MYKKLLITVFSLLITTSSIFAYQTAQEFEDTLYINLVENIIGDTLEVDFVVNNFNNIAAMQFSINYNSGLSYIGFESNFFNNQNFNDQDGVIRFSWNDQTTQGVDLSDGTIIFTHRFLLNGTQSTDIDISGFPLPIEIITSEFVQMALVVNGLNISFEENLLKGHLFVDTNNNCVKDEGEGPLSDWVLNIDGQSYFKTNQAGLFRKYVAPGEHTLFIELKNELWELCVSEVDFTIGEDENSIVEIPVGVKPIIACSRPEISGGTPFLRRCVENLYIFTYCNFGTTKLENPEINISYSDDFTFVRSSINPASLEDNNIQIQGENLEVGECKFLFVTFEVSCETTVLGETHCIDASIGPFENCVQPQNWSGADIAVDVECNNEEVNFTIKNEGDGNMTSPKNFIVIEDDVMSPPPTDEYNLNAGESVVFGFPANGKTYRLIAEQEENHPFPNNPTAAIEGCGTDVEGKSSLGYITQYADDDDAPFVETFCTEIIGSFDPNDKQGFPRGYGSENYIYKNTDIEFLIRFQNTGNDTAFNVVILDSLVPELDLKSIQVGPASHPFTWEVQNERTLAFKFSNILLPDSNVNLIESNGFIKYKVKQKADLEDGIRINTQAEIYFDFNEPIYTNITTHTIGSDFVISDIVENSPLAFENHLIYPNPSKDGIWIERINNEGVLKLNIYSADGRSTYQANLSNYLNYVDRPAFSNGLNFYSITTEDGRIYTGKILILE